MPVLKTGLVVVAVVGFAACRPAPTPEQYVQQLLDAFAPDLTLGLPLSPAARQRYTLQPGPYIGYLDNSFSGLDGVQKLVVFVTPPPEGRHDASPNATVTAVQLNLPEPSVTERVDARIRAVLGAPRVSCHRYESGDRVEIRWWPAPDAALPTAPSERADSKRDTTRGIRLEMFREDVAGIGVKGSGFVRLGAERSGMPQVAEACN